MSVLDQSLSRRRVLIGLGLLPLGAAPLIQACAPSASTSPSSSVAPGSQLPSSPSVGASPSTAAAARPPTAAKPDKLVFVTITDTAGDAVLQPALAHFTARYGVTAETAASGDADYLGKVLSQIAAGTQMDTIFVRENYVGQWIKDGVIQPISDMPGVDAYVSDATPIAAGVMQQQGEAWGLPMYGEVLTFWYNEDNFKKAGLTTPPTTWEEVVSQAQQAQKAGFAHPILWAAGQGESHLPWQWFELMWTRGGSPFAATGEPQMGKGSIARDTLQWWQDSFQVSGISDPASATLRYVPAMKAFSTGNHVFCGVMPNTFLLAVNDPAQSPTAGKVKQILMPGNGKSFGYVRMMGLTSTTKSPEWSWELAQALCGKDLDGLYSVPTHWSLQLGYVPTYNAVWDDATLRATWSEFFDFDLLKRQVDQSNHISQNVPVVYESWYNEWLNTANIQLQDCILGKTSADSACDAMAAKAVELKQSSS